MAITASLQDGKNTDVNIIYTGSLALQDMKGISVMVAMRWRISGILRAAITAGTEQPKPVSRGTAAAPGSPAFFMTPSSAKAAVSMNLLCSSMLSCRNSSAIAGTKESTLPVPAHTPSVTRLMKGGFIPALIMRALKYPVQAAVRFSMERVRKVPGGPNVMMNTWDITAAKESAAPMRLRRRLLFLCRYAAGAGVMALLIHILSIIWLRHMIPGCFDTVPGPGYMVEYM